MYENKHPSVKTFLISIICGLILLYAPSSSLGQRHKRLVIVGSVICVQRPDLGWPMEFESLEIFYVRIDKVVKGKSSSKYIRIAYGHNPTSQPQYNLPLEIFKEKARWKFELSEAPNFDGRAPVSSSLPDETKVKVSDLLPPEYPRIEELRASVATMRCVSVVGLEGEAATLETKGTMKGYWLDFDRKSFKKL